MAKKEETIFVQIDNEVIELTGADKEAFLEDRKARVEAQEAIQAELLSKQETRKNALKKLAEASGLTDEEIQAII